jgi:RNA polymerase sigma-70 factor (ECF subfamily)
LTVELRLAIPFLAGCGASYMIVGPEDNKLDPRQTAEFVKLLTTSQRRIFAHIVNFLPNSADAEEVLQETNVVLWSKAQEFTPGTLFSAWACKVAYLQVLAFRKRVQRNRITFSSELMETFAEEVAQVDYQDDHRRALLSDCMQKLRPGDRELVSHRYIAGSTPPQIAEKTNRPLKSIYRSLGRIRILLFDCVRNKLAKESVS